MAVPIVGAPLLGVPQDLVRLVDFLELRYRVRVFVAVGVQLQS